MTTWAGELGRDSDGRAHDTVFLVVTADEVEEDVDADEDEPDLSWRVVNLEKSRKLKAVCFFNESLLLGGVSLFSIDSRFLGGVSPIRPSCKSFPSQPVSCSSAGATGGDAGAGVPAREGNIDGTADGVEKVLLRLCELRRSSQLSRRLTSSVVFANGEVADFGAIPGRGGDGCNLGSTTDGATSIRLTEV